MATYAEILAQAKAKWLSAEDVAAKSKTLGLDVTKMAWYTPPTSVTAPAIQTPVATQSTSWHWAIIKDAAKQWLWAWYALDPNKVQATNITWWQTVKQWYTAPSGKYYNLDVANDWTTSFTWMDGLMKTFKSQSEAQNYIASQNAKGSAVNYSDAQAWYKSTAPDKYTTWSSQGSDLKLPKDTTWWTAKDFEDFDWSQKVDSLNKSLSSSFNQLWFDNASFKKTAEDNMKAQMIKNNELQKELDSYKSQIDSEFSLVRWKFDKNTQEQVNRIDTLEKTYMENMNQLRWLQWDFYNTQTEALNDRVWGEQSWLQWALSAKGIDQSVINDAVTKARSKHLDQYNTLKDSNIKVLSELNTQYSNFANNVNAQRKTLNDEDLALVKSKFDLHKTMADTGTKLSNDLITNTFKPYEDAIAAQTWAQVTEMWYQAMDKAVADRFDSSNVNDRKQMLQIKFSNLTSWDAAGTKMPLTKIDIDMLNKAATLPTYADAIQFLVNWWSKIAWTTSWASSAISQWSKGNLKEKAEPKVPSWTPTKLSANTNIGTWLESNVSWDNLASAEDVKGLTALTPTDAARDVVSKYWVNPLTRPKNILAALKNSPAIIKTILTSKPTLTAALKTAISWLSKAWNVLLKWTSAINPEYAAIDIVNSWVLDNKAQTQTIDKQNTLLSQIQAKVDEYKNKWLTVPQNIIDAYSKIHKERYWF